MRSASCTLVSETLRKHKKKRLVTKGGATMNIVVRGIAYMLVIAAVFGLWQRDFLAGLFMFLLLLFIEKLFRVLLDGIDKVLRAIWDTQAVMEGRASDQSDSP